jgi:DNA-binding HxlR family transcriptional regulator
MQVQSVTIRDMLGNTYDAEVCSAARALELVGERWSLLIVRNALFAGATRFSDFHKLGMATNILTSRLDGFLNAAIMERRNASGNAGQHEYVLTEKGRELAAVIIALTEWGDRWAAPDGPPILYSHARCGAPISQRTTCTDCGALHDATELRALPGPGMPDEIAERMRRRNAAADLERGVAQA